MRTTIIAVSLVLIAGISYGAPATTTVGVYDPTGQSPQEIQWPPYPADPPPGFHWQRTGGPAVQIDPITGHPLPGRFIGGWILVRDGHVMPQIKGPSQR
jgi:hypothetical protein